MALDGAVRGVDQLVVGQPRGRHREHVDVAGDVLVPDHEVAGRAVQPDIGERAARGVRRPVDEAGLALLLDAGGADPGDEVDLVDAERVHGERDPAAVGGDGGLALLVAGVGEGAQGAGGQVQPPDAVAAAAPVGRQHQPGAVRQPVRLPVVVAAGRQLLQPGAVGPHRPDVEVAVPVGLERQRAAVRRPRRAGRVLQVAGQPARGAALDREHPDRGHQVDGQLLAARCRGDHHVGALGQPGDGVGTAGGISGCRGPERDPARCCGGTPSDQDGAAGHGGHAGGVVDHVSLLGSGPGEPHPHSGGRRVECADCADGASGAIGAPSGSPHLPARRSSGRTYGRIVSATLLPASSGEAVVGAYVRPEDRGGCPGWDSNPHWMVFETIGSAGWPTRARAPA